jgi:hypothetical protein
MLRAHYNMPAADFIAQLRTYVIAMGLSPQVVDAVDNLAGADDLEEDHLERLREAKDDGAMEAKNEIKAAVEKWFGLQGMALEADIKAAIISVIENS